MYCLFDFCCICFTNKDSLQHLSATDSDNVTYFIKLSSCIPEMCFNELNDRRLICKKCCENIKIVYKFRQKCLRSKTTLLDYISQLHQVSNIRGEVNVYLIDIHTFDTVKQEYQIDNIIKSELFKDVDNDTYEKEHSEIKSEHSTINLTLTDTRPNYIKLGNVVIKMESEVQNFEHKEKMIDDLGNHDEINIDLSHNDIELAASEIKKENQNQVVEEHLQTSFDNILETCDSENCNIDRKLKENSVNLENCSEDFLLNPDEIKIDIVHNDIELMDSEINMQCKIEDIEKFSNEDLAIPLNEANVYNADADKYEFFNRKIMEEKLEIIVPSTSKVQDIGNRKVETIRKQIHECNICMKTFRYIKSLKNHMRIHTGENSYECNFCKNKFTSLCNLAIHMLTHTGEKPYECNVCKKKFTYSGQLSRHMLIHTGEKPHECNICKKKFTQSSNLSTHMLIHTEKKSYVCNICKKKFRQPSSLSNHMVIHTGEKRYECNICKKKFRRSNHLSTHVNTHRGKAI